MTFLAIQTPARINKALLEASQACSSANRLGCLCHTGAGLRGPHGHGPLVSWEPLNSSSSISAWPGRSENQPPRSPHFPAVTSQRQQWKAPFFRGECLWGRVPSVRPVFPNSVFLSLGLSALMEKKLYGLLGASSPAPSPVLLPQKRPLVSTNQGACGKPGGRRLGHGPPSPHS